MTINPASTPTSSVSLSTTIVLSVPASPAVRDFAFAQVGWAGGTGVGITPPAGWTLIRRVDSTTVVGQATYYRVIDGSEGASYTWTLDTSVQNSGQMDLYRSDANGVLSLDVENGQSNASSANVTAPSITTSVINTMLVFGGGIAGAVTFTPPTGFTERTDVNSGTIAYKNQAASGATGAITATASAAGLNIAFLIAIKEVLPTIEQEGFRFRNDDGSETTATWRQTQDTNDSVAVSTRIRLRTLINTTGDTFSGQYKLQYRKVGDDTWMDVQ